MPSFEEPANQGIMNLYQGQMCGFDTMDVRLQGYGRNCPSKMTEAHPIEKKACV